VDDDLKAEILKQVQEWESALERPPAYRCKRCPDGDYQHSFLRAEKVATEKLVWARTKYVPVEQDSEVFGWKCNKCGFIPEGTDGPAMSIGPLFDMGSAGELRYVCTRLREIIGVPK
jgi:hypothetical protein